MSDLYIQGITMPKDASLWLVIKPDGTVHKIKNGDKYDGPAHQLCKAIVLRTSNHDLIERPNLIFTPDYKDVRNGLKRAIKETKRDGRVIVGLPVELLEQTVVALDELRSVLRYVKNARVVVPAEETNTHTSSTTVDTSPTPTSKLEIGNKVIFQSDFKHRCHPKWYPPVGTIGTVVALPACGSSFVIIQWPDGTTSNQDQWGCDLIDIIKLDEDNT